MLKGPVMHVRSGGGQRDGPVWGLLRHVSVTCLEIATADKQINGATFRLFHGLQRRVDFVQISMAATLHRYLWTPPRMCQFTMSSSAMAPDSTGTHAYAPWVTCIFNGSVLTY